MVPYADSSNKKTLVAFIIEVKPIYILFFNMTSPKKSLFSFLTPIRGIVVFCMALIMTFYFGFDVDFIPIHGYYEVIQIFASISAYGYAMVIINNYMDRRLTKSIPLENDLTKKIILQFALTIFTSILLYSFLYIGFYSTLKQDISFYSYSYYLFISLFITFSETLVFTLYKIRRVYYSSIVPTETSVEKPVIKDVRNYLSIKTSKKIINLDIEKIRLVFSQKGIVSIKDQDQQTYITQYTSLNDIIDSFPEHLFFRVNRQHLVNRHIIKSIESGENRKLCVYLNDSFLKDEEYLSCSRYKSKELKDWLSSNS